MKMKTAASFLLVCALLLAGSASSVARAARHAPAQKTASGPPWSWLGDAPLLTIYGRAFDTAPVLGQLGIDKSFADMEWQIQPYAQGIKAMNGGRGPRIAVHLIYGMAIPCAPGGNCLLYLDDTGVDIVKQYIEPAARRHWLVILDDQLGLSGPVQEIKHMIDKGYLRYDNVEVALDPEFRTEPGQPTPGIPIGSVTAREINNAQGALNGYAKWHHLAHRKILLVHEFRSYMIQDRATLRGDFPYVDPVVNADGFGPPGVKAHVYDALLGSKVSPGVKWRGLKLFLPSPYEDPNHGDFPVMTWAQVFGRQSAVDSSDGKSYRIDPVPNVIIIA